MKRHNIEHEIQSAFIVAARRISGCEWIYAIQNATPVRIRDAEDAKLARIKAQQYSTAEGRLKGILDVFLPFSFLNEVYNEKVFYHGLYLETKKPTMIVNGKKIKGRELTPEQASFIIYANNHGYGVAIYDSVQAGIDILLRYIHGQHNNAPAVLAAQLRIEKELKKNGNKRLHT